VESSRETIESGRPQRVSFGLVALLCAGSLVGHPSTASAEGSGGSGGAAGRRDNWPCTSCIFETPAGYDASVPTPLIVTFHGDSASIEYIHGNVQENAEARGFLVASFRCPRDLGCWDSWWRWEDSNGYDESWVGAQIDAIEAEYDVALEQVFLVGFSGGSSFLSDYLLDNSDRYAGGLFLGGGNPRSRCSECLIPVWFIIGDQDFLLDNAERARDSWSECGNEVDWQLVPGVDHQIIDSRLPAVFDEMAERTHPCMIQPDPPGDPDAGPEPQFADAGVVTSDDAGIDEPEPGPGAADGPITGGCAASVGLGEQGRPFAVALLLLFLLARRRATARPCRSRCG